MEDVVLHYQPGSTDRLSTLLERTEKLLEPFPCRPPPVFTPWFPVTAADRRLPIRPAKPAPIILSLTSPLPHDGHFHTAVTRLHPENKLRKPKRVAGRPPAATADSPPTPKDTVSDPQTSSHALASMLGDEATKEENHKDGAPLIAATDTPLKRSWSVFAQRGVLLQNSQLLSQHFHHMVSVHRLHLRQRAKWVIGQHNCGAARDVEQVWRALSRPALGSRLPTCNANVRRDRAEIWVFCDVLYAEQVGRFLKEQLELSGGISLCVHKFGNVFSM
ncbi:shieldin complex subunit 3 isoform 1-T2 [Aulostomus maculatus]